MTWSRLPEEVVLPREQQRHGFRLSLGFGYSLAFGERFTGRVLHDMVVAERPHLRVIASSAWSGMASTCR